MRKKLWILNGDFFTKVVGWSGGQVVGWLGGRVVRWSGETKTRL